MRIAFLYNHDQLHQVAHSAATAFELSRSQPDVDVSLITSSAAQERMIEAIAPRFPGERCARLPIRLPAWKRSLCRLVDPLAPVTKVAMLRSHVRTLRTFDAVVTPEKTVLMIQEELARAGTRLIHTRHGAGDRAIGFNAESARFDYVLASGPKIRRRLVERAEVEPSRIAIVGYPKFDAVGAFERPERRLFDNDRPTVLYCPHPSPHLSSWYRFGRSVLDFFARSREYNLIFAPHVMLFRRKLQISIDRLAFGRPGSLAQRYRDCPHIHIDLGSAACSDMTYTRLADYFLGDVSSQIYEFLVRPRPCLFLDGFGTDWRDDPSYAAWGLGPVLECACAHSLGGGLREAAEGFPGLEPTQRAYFADSIALPETTTSARCAADAIVGFLSPGRCPSPSLTDPSPMTHSC